VNELLRYEGPVQLTVRVAAENFELEGKKIRKGDRVTMVIASANHDETRFAQPERLDLGRTGGRPLSFGYGVHACVGASLGRMEAQVVLGEFARRFPSTWLENNAPRRLQTIVFRGLEELHVTLA
jgi:cytochrome P450